MKPKQAHAAVARAIKSGKLWRPLRCNQCLREGKVHGHHTDYSNPLEVIWLCPPCHRLEHPEKWKPRPPQEITRPRPDNWIKGVRERFGLDVPEMANLIGVLKQDWFAWEMGIS